MILGRGPSPFEVLLDVQRLPDTSLTSALQHGGREHFGWGRDRYLQSDTYNLIAQLIRAAGNWKKKPPEIEPYPTPGKKKRDTSASTTSDDKSGALSRVFAMFGMR